MRCKAKRGGFSWTAGLTLAASGRARTTAGTIAERVHAQQGVRRRVFELHQAPQFIGRQNHARNSVPRPAKNAVPEEGGEAHLNFRHPATKGAPATIPARTFCPPAAGESSKPTECHPIQICTGQPNR
jgi:hypothetical protein